MAAASPRQPQRLPQAQQQQQLSGRNSSRSRRCDASAPRRAKQPARGQQVQTQQRAQQGGQAYGATRFTPHALPPLPPDRSARALRADGGARSAEPPYDCKLTLT